MTTRLQGALLAALSLAPLTGCNATMSEIMASEGFTVRSEALRGAQIDAKASTLNWEVPNFSPSATLMDDMKLARGEVAQGLNGALGAGGKPARYRLTVLEIDRNSVFGLAPCFVALTLLGCPTGWLDVKVKLELDVAGKVYQAEGQSSAVTFLYTTESISPNLNGGWVALATLDALRKIDAQLAGTAEPTRQAKLEEAR